MGVLDQLDGELEQEDAPVEETGESFDRAEEIDPFLCNYDFEEWELDAETTDHALSLLIAVTNLI